MLAHLKDNVKYWICFLVVFALASTWLARSWNTFWWSYVDDVRHFKASFPGGGFKHESSASTVVGDDTMKYSVEVTTTNEGEFQRPLFQGFSSKTQILIQDEVGIVYEGPWAKEVYFNHKGFRYRLVAQRAGNGAEPDSNEKYFFRSFKYY